MRSGWQVLCLATTTGAGQVRKPAKRKTPPSPAPGGARPGRGCGGRAADAEKGRLGWGCRARRPDRGRAAGAGAAGCLAGEGGRDGRLRLGSENRCPRSEAGPSRPEAPALGADLCFLDRGFGLCRLFWLRPIFNRVDCVTRFSGNVISSIKLQFLFRPDRFQRVPVTVSMGRSHLGAALLSPLAMLNQSAFLTLVTRSFFGSALKLHFSNSRLFPVLRKWYPSQETRNQPAQQPLLCPLPQ